MENGTRNLDAAAVAVAAALAEVDVTAATAEIAEIDEQIRQVDAALASATARINELNREIAERRASGPDERAAAEALLAGDDVTERAPGPELLTEERDTVSAGMRGLRQRRRELVDAREDAESKIQRELAQAFGPAVKALEEETHDLIARLLDAQASLGAIARATNSVSARTLIDKLYGIRQAAAEARLLPIREGSVSEALAPLVETATALRAGPRPSRDRAGGHIVAKPRMPEGPLPMTHLH